jgi:hypothetical protein
MGRKPKRDRLSRRDRISLTIKAVGVLVTAAGVGATIWFAHQAHLRETKRDERLERQATPSDNGTKLNERLSAAVKRFPPTVAISAPPYGATVAGTITVAATAADDIGIVGVQFRLNGAELGTKTAMPFAVAWDTTALANGTYTLSAVARDAEGNEGVSAGTAVAVANP